MGRGEGPRREARQAARERLAQNPFYILGLRPSCARAEVEREGQKLLGMLELELSGAQRYRSPLGVHRRSPELVREAMAELRDPDRRLVHELWASLEVGTVDDPGDPAAVGEAGPERELPPRFPALRALGFGKGDSR